MNSKFHIHVPYLKLEQLRVELDNTSSDFENENLIWKSVIHKGSGKTALYTEFDNNKLHLHMSMTPYYNEFKQDLDIQLKDKIYDSLVFQKKNCDLPCDDINHISPMETLDIVAELVNKYDLSEKKIKISELNDIFKYKTDKEFPLKVIYSLYGVNRIVEYLNESLSSHSQSIETSNVS